MQSNTSLEIKVTKTSRFQILHCEANRFFERQIYKSENVHLANCKMRKRLKMLNAPVSLGKGHVKSASVCFISIHFHQYPRWYHFTH